MKIIVDLDGTICTEEKQFSRSLAKVNPGAKEALNLLKEKGFPHTSSIESIPQINDD